MSRIRATRSVLVSGLLGLGFAPLPSSANFVFARAESAAVARAAYRFAKERGVLVRYFDRRLLDDGLRITVGTDAEVAELLTVLADFRRSVPAVTG